MGRVNLSFFFFWGGGGGWGGWFGFEEGLEFRSFGFRALGLEAFQRFRAWGLGP